MGLETSSCMRGHCEATAGWGDEESGADTRPLDHHWHTATTSSRDTLMGLRMVTQIQWWASPMAESGHHFICIPWQKLLFNSLFCLYTFLFLFLLILRSFLANPLEEIFSNHFCFVYSLTLINNKGLKYTESSKEILSFMAGVSTEVISHNLQWQIPIDLRSIWDFIDSPKPKSIDKTL